MAVYTQGGIFTATINGQAFTCKKATYTINNLKQDWVENYQGDTAVKVTPQVVKATFTILYNSAVDLTDFIGLQNATVVLALPAHTLSYNSAVIADIGEGDASDDNSVTVEIWATQVQEI